MFQTKVVEKIKTHILCLITFLSENRAVYEIMWKYIVERGRPTITTWHTRIHVGYLRLNTHTHTHTHTHLGCVTLIAFPPQQWVHEPALVLRYT